jgi:predicted MPP superfamily phosphohydrolase
VLVLLGFATFGRGYFNATRDPIVQQAELSVDGIDRSLRILVLTDIHVAGPDMPPTRLSRIVSELNRFQPDLVLIAGDLVSEKRLATHVYTAAEVVEPLAEIRAPLGTVAVLGNHDHWFDSEALGVQLQKQRIKVLENSAIDLGPIVVGGVGDEFTGHDDVPATVAAMAGFKPKPRVVIMHSPDAIPELTTPVTAIFAGHTHCGQIAVPIFGPISYMSRYGERFACGAIEDGGQKVFVGAGLGTSILPLRFGAPPDVWLVTLRPSGT